MESSASSFESKEEEEEEIGDETMGSRIMIPRLDLRDGGDGGGQVIAKGTPEEVSENKKSYTGAFLKDMLKKGQYE